MEEPPKIEHLLSSRGISLSDAATILKSYVAIIDKHHAPRQPATASAAASSNNDANNDNTNKNTDNDNNNNGQSRPDKELTSREEQEEERLLAKLNQLDPINESSTTRGGIGTISEDVQERLHLIMKSVCGEAEGCVVSAVGVYHHGDSSSKSDVVETMDNGQTTTSIEEQDFRKELEEAEQQQLQLQLEQSVPVEKGEDEMQQQEQQQEQQRQQSVEVDYEQKKKDKKAKKAAKKAKKKRRASDGGGGAVGNDEKRIKAEEQ